MLTLAASDSTNRLEFKNHKIKQARKQEGSREVVAAKVTGPVKLEVESKSSYR